MMKVIVMRAPQGFILSDTPVVRVQRFLLGDGHAPSAPNT